ncbi:hypothetical protein [Bradyrhizobium sp.]|uniref:hypothetical protein n=1 Tax=Bradyrhizobium sp. TaxID=376 RepID=UPI002733B7B8|nr:hypothetical protein [Bradyrhizobium sp.]MDP3691357.1 hypothetical protein [Bradyrhizobium sp.]
MATIASEQLTTPADRHGGRTSRPHAPAEFRDFWRQFLARAFDTYRPEQHYMRGPGPACRAKQAASSQRHSS